MLSKAPPCRAVCMDSAGSVMDELVIVFQGKRSAGMSEADALSIARDGQALTRMLPRHSVGELHSVADALSCSGCAECAVNKAYTD
jgi:hypothetical protein